jgi:DNA-binding IclR family transcriptional regulator
VIENGIDPAAAVALMLAGMAADEREIIVAEGRERDMAELRRTPEALFDQMAALVASGYAAKLETTP